MLDDESVKKSRALTAIELSDKVENPLALMVSTNSLNMIPSSASSASADRRARRKKHFSFYSNSSSSPRPQMKALSASPSSKKVVRVNCPD
jgi:hypothetical protein